jgi:outer membrane protein OmpA-like peptidoglycan-associated protein
MGKPASKAHPQIQAADRCQRSAAASRQFTSLPFWRNVVATSGEGEMRGLCLAVVTLNLCAPSAAQTKGTRVEMSVFFRWNAEDLDPGAVEVVEAAAGRAKACKRASIELVGHDDRSQTGERAQELSELRAQAVQRALASAGIPEARIKTEGRGDRNLMFNTPDGVKESMNRRVDIAVVCTD